jgi:thymidylate synthase (FAD)
MDSLIRVNVLNEASNPQQAVYAAMHQDYSDGFVWHDRCSFPDETESGNLVVKNLLNGGRGHFGPLEHPQIVFNCGWFPHSVLQQIRTHRVGVSFDCQSFRFTGTHIYNIGDRLMSDKTWDGYTPGVWRGSEELQAYIENVIYLRPIGEYTDRKGDKYQYTEQSRLNDLALAAHLIAHYTRKIDAGLSEEHARGMLPFDYRQHWVMSFNLRSLMHLLDLRAKADAQLECQWLCDLIWPHFEAWVPEVAAWYRQNRWAKARLAP